MEQATIFSVEEFSTFDGPGIRMTVFFKGCPLSCKWCHNPEGQSFEVEYIKNFNGCVSCGNCLKHVKNSNGNVKFLPKAVDACKRNLLRKAGKVYTVEELASYINRTAEVLTATGGGVTFSGGEPLCFIDFISKVVSKLNNVSVAFQISGYGSKQSFEKALKLSNYVLFDLKIINDKNFQKYCGKGNQIILENYRLLAKSNVEFITRVPLIPTVTDTAENLTDIAKFMAENKVNKVELLPYNEFTSSKYKGLLRKDEPAYDIKNGLNHQTIIEIFNNYGITAVIK